MFKAPWDNQVRQQARRGQKEGPVRKNTAITQAWSRLGADKLLLGVEESQGWSQQFWHFRGRWRGCVEIKKSKIPKQTAMRGKEELQGRVESSGSQTVSGLETRPWICLEKLSVTLLSADSVEFPGQPMGSPKQAGVRKRRQQAKGWCQGLGKSKRVVA